MMDEERVKALLEEQKIEGWLLYDFQKSNPLALQILDIEQNVFISRRFFYWLPREGMPVKIVHRVEKHILDHLDGDTLLYSSQNELEECLKSVLKGMSIVAMEYSPRGALPYLSKVDGGTLDLVRGCGVQVVSSAPLLQRLTSILSVEQVKSHCFAADVLEAIVEETVNLIREYEGLSEYDVALIMQDKMKERHCTTNHLPIVAVGPNSANPHYIPTKEKAVLIKSGDFILLDLWCKNDAKGSVYADICRVMVKGVPSQKHKEIFDIVRRAQQASIELIQERFVNKISVTGFEVDRAARKVIEDAGYGAFFTHRTGHNIYEEDHGSGTHIDSFETEDHRQIIPSTCFSVEPGIYLPGEFGVRLETDILIDKEGNVHITGGIQDNIYTS